ncbi:SOS response-associated peptidase [Chelativorans salis]|uniref:SOS response-associated peptidase n=1 Tax=Chelativorans salis TaxID=2978478 RepID=A0ABT2LHW8_9HYPH|nr:SOS response-associated peptidase [Chelativorans sp. EGI FJ00035]MCT7374100.1 SOS response-associated peptidase [Chelativorans sp. EGI FJ00035]
MWPRVRQKPVIIAPDDYPRWLAFHEEDPRDLLKSFPTEKMKIWPIGRKVGNTWNNTSDILDPIEEEEPPLISRGTIMTALHETNACDVEATARLFYEFATGKRWRNARSAIRDTWLEAARQLHDILGEPISPIGSPKPTPH